MKKYNKVIITFVFLFVVLFSFNNVYAKEFTIDNKDYYIEYNTILVDMDKTFSYLKNAYGFKSDDELINELSKLFLNKKHTSGSCSDSTKNNYAYRISSSQKVTISKKNQQIYVPDIYNICVHTKYPHIKIDAPVTIDDSVNVTIEIKNNKYYVPIYFFSSIPGVSVMVDNKTVYTSTNYVDVNGALNKNSSSHTVKLIVNKITNYSSLAKDIGDYEYFSEEDGALWREEAKKRIEKNRKASVNITVSDKNGNLINDVVITAKQTGNTFKFGTAIANNNGVNNFNGITSTYFNSIGAEDIFKGKFYYAYGADKTLKYRNDLIKKANNLGIKYVRGHTLYWDKWDWSTDGLVNSGIRNIIGTKTETNPDIITMASVRLKYDNYHNDGNGYTADEKKDIDSRIQQLKDKLLTRIKEYIKITVETYSSVNEWDLFNELAGTIYFRYYLFGEKFLTDPDKVFLTYDGKTTMSDNNFDEYLSETEFKNRFAKSDYKSYLDFLADCLEYYRKLTKNLMVINESKVNGIYSRGINNLPNSGKYDSSYNPSQWLNISSYQAEWLMKALNERLKSRNMKTIDAIGFESHVHERYFITPNSYYNAYNKFLKNIGVNRGRVTEFNICHYCDSGNMAKVSTEEKKLRAKYLSDFLIATYSNSKMELFFTWVYTNTLTKEEQDAYKSTVYNWLNDTEEDKTTNGKSELRLYKGKYTITAKYNGKTVTKNIDVSSGTNKVDIKLDNVIQNILGDANNDGKINTSDYIMIRKHILKISSLTSAEVKRADMDQNGKITSLDYIAIRKIIISK